jgi:hypothetical protein
MFAADNPFLPQARLAARVLRSVAREPDLALKGGTAINLFFRDLPRLSVDLDLTYLRIRDRKESLNAIGEALERIERAIFQSSVERGGWNDSSLCAYHGDQAGKD